MLVALVALAFVNALVALTSCSISLPSVSKTFLGGTGFPCSSRFTGGGSKSLLFQALRTMREMPAEMHTHETSKPMAKKARKPMTTITWNLDQRVQPSVLMGLGLAALRAKKVRSRESISGVYVAEC